MKRKIFSALAVVLFMSSNLNAENINLRPSDCMEWAEEVEHEMTDGNCDAEIFNMAYSYCETFMDFEV